MRVAIDRIDHHLVQQLDSRHRNPQLDRGDHRPHGAFHRVERTHRRGDRLGQAVHAQRDLGNHAERSLGPDEETRQVVTGRRLSRAAAGADDAPVGKHHGQPRTVSRIVPYRTVVVPDAPVATMPPIVASAPGSTQKYTPVFASALFN